MKNTKNVILNTALSLFNSKGLSQVTLRTIANEMGISQGNLCYHFKKRDEIIEGLYFRLVSAIDHGFSGENHLENGLEKLFHVSRTIMRNFYEYRFFMLDFVQIMRENETIKDHYKVLSSQREIQFERLLLDLMEAGIIRPAELPDEYLNLYLRIKIMGDFWISSAVTSSRKMGPKIVEEYYVILNQSLYPYLTAKGKDMFKAHTDVTVF